jgi:hypothetical protein
MRKYYVSDCPGQFVEVEAESAQEAAELVHEGNLREPDWACEGEQKYIVYDDSDEEDSVTIFID